MFLNKLQTKEKEAFLELANYVANSDNELSKEEEKIIEKYSIEMQIEPVKFDKDSFDIYTTLSKFQSDRSKKIVLLEILALIYADDFIHEEERIVLEKMMQEFDINPNLVVIYKEWAKSMLSLFTQGNALINL
jgi:uncharacterized tellurite resistance protein B-like protein